MEPKVGFPIQLEPSLQEATQANDLISASFHH